MKIFIINLKRSEARRKKMALQLDRLKLEYEFFDAIDGQDLSQREIEKYYDMEFFSNRPSYYKMGAVGCTLSHFLIYKKIVAERVRMALILEDDIYLNKDLCSILPKLETKIKSGEVIMLYYHSTDVIEAFPSENIMTISDVNYSLYNPRNYRLASTCAYMLNYDTAERLSNRLFPIKSDADDWAKFFKWGILSELRLVYPYLVENAFERTTVNPAFSNNKIMRSLLNFIEQYKIFPLYQYILFQRKKYFKNRQQFKILHEP